MGALAHTLEAAGLATVAISLVRRHAELARPPRVLHCDFPLGRPLGRPGDAGFQRAVLERAFALLEREDVPVLEDHPEAIHDEAGSPLACALPPAHDPSLPPSLDEALALVPAQARGFDGGTDRPARPSFDVERLTSLVSLFDRLADGHPWEAEGLTELEVHQAGLALRTYYEQAALGLADHVPAARQAESWFFQQTVVGNRVRQAQQRLREAGAPRGAWAGLVPSTQPRPA